RARTWERNVESTAPRYVKCLRFSSTTSPKSRLPSVCSVQAKFRVWASLWAAEVFG
ncbi:TPA: hypothetical protein N0F65_005682, partial [Lagenidium giganteum]